MPLPTTDRDNQLKLKDELQSDPSASKFEKLTAALVGELLDVPIAVAKSGFQHGGDSGPAGRRNRRFRLECKKYGDKTSLSDRELLGEIDHALARDKALEAWILVATRSVPEQLYQDLVAKGEASGVPVIVIDWSSETISPLAALCALNPDLVETLFSSAAAAYARALKPVAQAEIDNLKRDLQSWCLGFAELRERSHDKLRRIWGSSRASNAALGQDAAGGAHTKRVERTTVSDALQGWWTGPSNNDSPCAVVGTDGVGKTWATLDWLVRSADDQPIIFVIPSSAAPEISGMSETAVKRFLAIRLHELTGVRDPEHWIRRIEYLLSRPHDEGPAITIFFDGLNQEPSFAWLKLLKVLQGEAFEGRVRTIISTRQHYYEDRLSKLRGLTVPATSVSVGLYGANPGGELDKMLAFEGVSREDLHPDLLELARTPRLFALVVRFRDRLVEAGQVTIHRLLWEYGRDSLGVRAGASFSEDDWRAWLSDIARRHRDGVEAYSLKTLGETASRPDLNERQIYARLSDIVDGRFAIKGTSGELRLAPTVVAHALGAALLARLDEVSGPTYETISEELTQWLDPISGLDQRAEILRAAVSISLERGREASSPIDGALVTVWLQTQNMPDSHRHELAALASALPDALIDAVEHSSGSTHASARLWAVNALRAISREDTKAYAVIIDRLSRAYRSVTRGLRSAGKEDAEREKRWSDQLTTRIGTSAFGPITVVGIDLALVQRAESEILAAAPSILEGFPLADALPVFERAAAALAISNRSESWEKLKWLCLLNETDAVQTTEALRHLSSKVRARQPEKGVHPDLPARIASLLLWLTGDEEDEILAVSLDPGLDRSFTYKEDYLPNPGKSLFPVERRHATAVLCDSSIPVLSRIDKVRGLLLDPQFEPPATFVSDLRCFALDIDVEKLHRHSTHTIEEHHFERLEPALARCAPDLLSELARRTLMALASCPPESRYWSAIHCTDHFMLADDQERASATTLRASVKESTENEESFVSNQLLAIEIYNMDVRSQIRTIILADAPLIFEALENVLKSPTPDDIDALITEFEKSGTTKQKDDLFILVSAFSTAFSDAAWAWLVRYARDGDPRLAGLAFRALTTSDAVRFGRLLAADDWSWNWDPAAEFWVNHYGTRALVEATLSQSFDQIAPRVAPWQLLEAARFRGGDPSEVRLAAEIFGSVLMADKVDPPDLGADVSINRDVSDSQPLRLTITTQSRPPGDGDIGAWFKAAADRDGQMAAHRRAIDTAIDRIREAHRSGARLYLADIDVVDLEPVVRHAPDMLDKWLDGLVGETTDFRRRVQLAEGAFLALCEILLTHDPDRGIQLWHILRTTLRTRFVGSAGVDDLLHIVFRAPDSPSVECLRSELIELPNANTDQALFDVAVAAIANGKAEWLNSIIDNDRAFDVAWKKRRAIVLSGFTIDNTLPVRKAWPEGEVKTNLAELEHKSARRCWSDSCARHWWRTYLGAPDKVEAYAAWILFLRASDERAFLWMEKDRRGTNQCDALLEIKLNHVGLNHSQLKNWSAKNNNKLKDTFLGKNTVHGISPWLGDVRVR